MKKVILIAGIFGLILVGAGLILIFQSTTENNSELIEYRSGDDPVELVGEWQEIFVELATAYRDAQLSTQAMLITDHQKTDWADYTDLYNDTLTKWDEVGQAVDKLETLNKKLALHDSVKLKQLHFAPFMPVAHAYSNGDGEVELKLPAWDRVDLIKSALPQVRTSDIVADEFGITKKEAVSKVISHYTEVSNNQQNWVKINDIGSKTSQVLVTSSKVGLFIGASVITFGGATVATLPAGAALATGFGANVGAFGALTTTISGVDLALELGETTSLVFGDEEGKAAYTRTRNAIKPVTTFLAVKDLTDLSNPANIITAYELGSELYTQYTHLDFTNKKGLKVIRYTPENGQSVYYPKTNSDGLIDNMLPADIYYQRDLLGGELNLDLLNQPDEPVIEEAVEERSTFFGAYHGTVNLPVAPGMPYVLTYPIKVFVKDDSSVIFRVEGSSTVNFGGGVGITASTNTELPGTIDKKGNLVAEGGISFVTKVNLPVGANQLPPEYQAIANGITGSAIATIMGTYGESSFTNGTIDFSSQGTTTKGTWTAKY